MKFRRGSSRPSQHSHGLDAELDACLNLLASRPAGRDQTDAILSRVACQVPLVSAPRRRLLSLGRLGVGLAALACVGVSLVTLSAWRETSIMTAIAGPSSPVSGAVASTFVGVDNAVRQIGAASRGAGILRPASLLTADIETAPPAPSRAQAGPSTASDAASLALFGRVIPPQPRDLAESVAWQMGGDASGAALPR